MGYRSELATSPRSIGLNWRFSRSVYQVEVFSYSWRLVDQMAIDKNLCSIEKPYATRLVVSYAGVSTTRLF